MLPQTKALICATGAIFGRSISDMLWIDSEIDRLSRTKWGRRRNKAKIRILKNKYFINILYGSMTMAVGRELAKRSKEED